MTLSQTNTHRIAKRMGLPHHLWPKVSLMNAMDNHKFITCVKITGTATIVNPFGMAFHEKDVRLWAELLQIYYNIMRCN